MNSTTVYSSPYEPAAEELRYLNEEQSSSESSSQETRETHSLSPEAASSTADVAYRPTTTTFNDDEHVYANISDMGKRDSTPVDPQPSETDQPRRVLPNGWTEYVSHSGRPYFFNSETGRCQWIPPRLMRSSSQIEEYLDATTKSTPQANTACMPCSNRTSSEESFDSVASTDGTSSLPGSPIKVAAPCSEMIRMRQAELEAARMSTMPRFVPSLYRPTSLVARNRGSLKLAEPPRVPEFVPLPVVPSTATDEPPDFDAPAPSSSHAVREDTPQSVDVPRRVKQGNMERLTERSRKREWVPCYFFLSTAHLLVYKDEKSAEKHGKHYEAPLMAIDLRGASISWIVDRDKKKRKFFQLTLPPQALGASAVAPLILRSTNDGMTEDWFDTIRWVVAQLPAHSADSINAASVALPISVIRNPSALGIVRPHSSYTMAKKRSDVRPDPMSASAYDASPVPLVPAGSSAISNEPAPSRESIFEMLKRFFRSRPTVESLKAKGIYKPEPVFGSTLAAICQTEQTLVPRFIQVVTELIETKFLEIDGLYRVSGNLSAVQKIRCQVDQDRYQLLVAEEDVHVLTGALKLFFRELAEPVFPVKMAKDFLAAMQVANGKSRLRRFDDLLKSLPPENRETLKLLLRHLNTVAKHADKNRMQAHNLAIMFGPTLFQSGAEDRPVVKKSKDKKKKGKDEPAPVQSNSHLAFHMIMQGQIVEFLLTDGHRLEALQGPIRRQP